MREHFLSFVWQHKLYDPSRLVTTDGRKILLKDTGRLNEDAGPDFKEARVTIDQISWSGHVELHVRSSDWYLHKHDRDPAYDSVVLHVVYEEDVPVKRTNGTRIPCLELKPIIRREYFERYESLQQNIAWLPCQARIGKVRDITVSSALQRMAIERYEGRVEELRHRLDQLDGNWPQLIFERFARGMGFRINGFAFEQIARQTPLKVIMKEAHELENVEALLFGQSGSIKENDDHYSKRLKSKFEFLRSKYDLSPLPPGQMKFLRTRPSNFPTIRLAQLASIIHHSPHFFHLFLEITNVGEWHQLLQVETSEYWQSHYDLGKRTDRKSNRKLSEKSRELLVINVLVPLQFAYASYLGSSARKDRTMKLLSAIPRENNKLIRQWKSHGISAGNALETQGMMHLHMHYCTEHKCLNCPIGHEIIRGL